MNDARIFEWDEEKRLANMEKHGIDFQNVTPAFDDENARHIPDLRNNYGETRIISARRANQKERQLYVQA